MTTVVLPSSRSIREALLEEQSDSFLPNYITIGEFLRRSVLVEGLSSIDEDTRTVLLLEAAAFENFSKLQIERNFLSFTKNASYIFGFFEELATENVSIEALPRADVYGEYEEHLEILKELRQRYKSLCLEHKLYDKIFLNELYTLNEEYLSSLGEVRLHVTGMLGNFELEIIEKALDFTKINAYFEADGFNKKMVLRLNERFGFELEDSFRYELSLNDRKIISQSPLKQPHTITLTPLSLKTLQIGFIKERIAHFINKGYKAEKIAVVLPDESFAKLLELYDDKNNFNFAMGKSFRDGFVYQKLKITLDAIGELNAENQQKLKRFGEDLYERLFGESAKKVSEESLGKILDYIAKDCRTKEEEQILKEERYLFLKLYSHIKDLSLLHALKLYLLRLSKRSFDDVGGGKITVMGLLETRGVEFDAVIVCDFNDAYVPKRLEKDMFLSSEIKKRVNLPTQNEREELQKHLYATLFRNAKEVALCYVESSTQTLSRFAKEIKQIKLHKVDENLLATTLLPKGRIDKQPFEPFEAEYDFSKERLSNSKLKTYLECKRKFYLRYMQGIENFEIPKDLPQEWEIGNTVHAALKNLYAKRQSFDNYEELYESLSGELEEIASGNPLERFQIAMYKELLKKFCQNEIERFHQGYKIIATEKECSKEVAGINLYGVIDRIDLRSDGGVEVVDYKTGSYKLYSEKKVEDASDFQLEFYYLLAEEFGKVERVGFYDLQKGKIVNEQFLHEKLAALQTHLEELAKTKRVEVTMCEDTAHCRYCEYKTICGRE